MKKLYSFFLLGEFILLSIIFSKSLYEIYGLSHIGDTKLAEYRIEKSSPEILGNVYDYLMKQELKVQIIKMPISKENNNTINYEIYHTDISSVFHFQGLSDTQYSYYNLSKEDFMDGTGIFYSNLNKKEIHEIEHKFSLKIDDYTSNSYTSFKTILYANGIDLLILIIVSFIVMLIYVISRNKENAIKILLGFSNVKIILSRIKETFIIELFSTILVSIGNVIYYSIIGKSSLFYALFLFSFLLVISCINIGLLFLTNFILKKISVESAIKNQRYSNSLDHFIQIGKIILFVVVSITISSASHYYTKITESQKNMEEYKELNNFFSCYGFNSDEYDKMCNNNALHLQHSKKVKQMYLDNMKQAFVMQDCVLTALDENINEEEFYGMGINDLFKSYKRNYIIVNKNYLEKYIKCKFVSGKIKNNKFTILVPQMYQNKEKKLIEHYKLVLEDKMSADNYYGENTSVAISNQDINIVYLDNDYSVKLLSDYQYKSEMNIEIQHPVIILDTGHFASDIYMDMLSNCQLSYIETNRNAFSAMLQKYDLDKLFSSKTMLAPFMEEISSYQFVLQQSGIFIALFTLTLIFLIYISNHIHLNVHAKTYGVKFQIGYGTFNILKSDIMVSAILLTFSILLKSLNISIYGYIQFVLIDFIILYILYRTIVVNQFYKIMNGGY